MRHGQHMPRGIHISSLAAFGIANAIGRREVLDRLNEKLPGPAHEETRRAAEEAMVAVGLEAKWFREEQPKSPAKKVERAKVSTSKAAEDSEWMTTTKAAEQMDISPQWVLRLRAEGVLYGERDTPGGPWRIRAAEVDAWVASKAASR